MSDFHVNEGDRVFLETPDGLLLRVVFGKASVELMASSVGSKLSTRFSSETAIAIDIGAKCYHEE